MEKEDPMTSPVPRRCVWRGPRRVGFLSGLSWALTLRLVVAFTPGLRALDTSQTTLLNDTRSQMQKLESSLALAQQTVGPGDGPVSVAKAKLAMVRLQSALDLVPQVKGRLERLPGGEAEVQPVAARFAAAVGAIEALRVRLAGGGIPASTAGAAAAVKPSSSAGGPSPAATVPAAAPSAKLDYRQQDELKSARYYLREVQGKLTALEKQMSEFQPVADYTRIDFRQVQRGMNTLAEARQRIGLIVPRLETLPAAGEGVAEIAQGVKIAAQGLDAVERVLLPLHAKLAILVDPKSHPKLASDTRRIRELAAMFADPSLLETDVVQATARVSEMAAARAEHDRVLAAYEALRRQSTPEVTDLTAASAHFQDRLGTFSAAVDARRAVLPGLIEKDFAQIDTMVKDAVANLKPAFFTSGIPDQVRFLTEKVDFLDTVEPTLAKPLRVRLQTTRARLAKEAVALRESIVASNELPRDEFQGGDRSELVKIATETWRKVEPSATIVGVRIPSAGWKRDSRWRNQTGDWYQIDRSTVQVQLIVQQSDTLAVIRPINLWKNHLEGNRITASPFHEKGEELQPHAFVLMRKVK